MTVTNKKRIIIATSFILIIICFFTACGTDANQSIFPQSPSNPSASQGDQTQANETSKTNSSTLNNDEKIRELEARIEELLNLHSSSSEEYESELEALRSELSELKKISPNNSHNDTEKAPAENTQTSTPVFLYSTDGDNATITGYTGNDTNIVIPSAIDGYTVISIAENAFSSKDIKSVVITNGITRIDWFAFEGCTSLESVTIPPSVSSIGYSAFSSAPKSLTIYCHNGSFAQSYAKSYGLSYTII